MTRIASSHHVLGIEHLLGKFGYCKGTVLLATTAGQRSETWHKEVETWEGYHVDSQFTEISIELTWETETGSDTTHGSRNQMVQVTVCWGGQFQCTEADI